MATYVINTVNSTDTNRYFAGITPKGRLAYSKVPEKAVAFTTKKEAADFGREYLADSNPDLYFVTIPTKEARDNGMTWFSDLDLSDLALPSPNGAPTKTDDESAADTPAPKKGKRAKRATEPTKTTARRRRAPKNSASESDGTVLHTTYEKIDAKRDDDDLVMLVNTEDTSYELFTFRHQRRNVLVFAAIPQDDDEYNEYAAQKIDFPVFDADDLASAVEAINSLVVAGLRA